MLLFVGLAFKCKNRLLWYHAPLLPIARVPSNTEALTGNVGSLSRSVRAGTLGRGLEGRTPQPQRRSSTPGSGMGFASYPVDDVHQARIT